MSPWIVGLLCASVLFYVVNNAIWLLNDASSPSYDKAAHAGFALQYLRLFEAPTRLSLAKLLNVTQYWPPLFHIASVPFTMTMGFSVASVAAANFLFLPIAVFGTYKVGQRLFDQWVGVGAVALLLLYPMVYALSREVLVDFALLAMVALSLHLILESDGGLNRRCSGRLGAAIGAAMLTKWTAVTFLLGPAILWLAVCLRRDRPRTGSATASLLKAALALGIVALPWYVEALPTFLEGSRVAFGSDPAREGDPTRIVESLRWYWVVTVHVLILTPLLVPTIGGLAASMVRRRSWAGPAFLWASILPAMVFFVLIPNKDARFIMPVLPAVAILAAAGLRSLPWRALRVATWAFILIAGFYQFYAISFAWPTGMPHPYTHAPRRDNWRMDEIVAAIATLEVPRPIQVAFLPNHPDFEPNIFKLAADVGQLRANVDGVGHQLEPIPAWTRYDVIVSKTGTIAVPYAAAFRSQLHRDLRRWIARSNRDPRITLWKTWSLPDGSRAEVYAVHHVPASPH